ncbi:TRAP transporter substrate-binding protein [Lysinibacillus sp. BW-2-10]|uniref:TRAP transporter substrate-binding protein n=1 Tax=Lysinibacillus sp. BW-2-10 TaxID=2590030 RepID=UPI00117F61B7|nr:TRAP transporter substrate-binding protein [Lysinibacillus sp. BW-2-10]TSI08715.1 TRAP transporter substrate-binding protein [Lysinibacillus sp. BW-2-10]
MKVKKISFLLAIFSMMLLLAACSSSSEETVSTGGSGESSNSKGEKVVLKFGSMDGPDHVQNKEVFTEFNEEVKKLTEGRVEFEMYTGGALGGPKETLDNILTGIMDVGRGLHGYNAGKYEAQSVMHLPFLADGNGAELSVVAQKLYDTFPEIQKEYSDIKPLWVHAADPYAIITKDKAVRSFEDVKGLKLRTPSVEGGKMIESWGATPVSLPAPEIYDALQKGVIDGGVLPIAAIKDFNLTDLVGYVTLGNFNTSLFYVSMNKDSWNKISPEDQKLIEETLLGIPFAEKAGIAFDGQKQRAEEEAKAAGAEFITLSEEELNKFKDASKGVTEEWLSRMEEKGIDGQKIYDEAVKLINE